MLQIVDFCSSILFRRSSLKFVLRRKVCCMRLQIIYKKACDVSRRRQSDQLRLSLLISDVWFFDFSIALHDRLLWAVSTFPPPTRATQLFSYDFICVNVRSSSILLLWGARSSALKRSVKSNRFNFISLAA